MHIHIPGPRGVIRCSGCGSARAVKPVNEPDVILRCDDCGHTKREPSRKKHDEWFRTWSDGMSARKIDDNPTF